jgi:Alpha/beta hydrolase domain
MMASVIRTRGRTARLAAAFAAALVTACVAGGVQLGGAGSLATATVTGPIGGAEVGDPSHDYPFYASAIDLKSRAYLEEEYFIQGTANRYTVPAGATGSIVDGGHPYKTRFAVRRPSSPSRFNGTVIVEWNNVTAGHDLDIDWFQTHDHLMDEGYAWVGVTPQRIGVEALKVWNAKRYGTLDVTDNSRVTNDDLSYDVFAAVGEAIRHPGAINALGGLTAQRIFATGHSQSAGRLATYVNSVHPLAHVFDAVIVHGGGGLIRTDLDIKVWKLLSETDVILSQAAVRQPDTNNVRTWEVAGDSHVDLQFTSYSRQLSQRDGSPIAPGFAPGGAGRGAPTTAARNGGGRSAAEPAAPARGSASPSPQQARGGGSACDRPSYSHIPFHYVMDAAINHLVRWVKDGTSPPTAARIEVTSSGPPAVIARDKYGNALGGIRLSQHEVATATNTGQNSGPGFCRLNGSYEPFDAATLASLYPTHTDYVAKVKAVTERNLRAGYILKRDADATIAEAERAEIGKR